MSDKEKAREYAAMARKRGITNQNVIPDVIPPDTEPDVIPDVIPKFNKWGVLVNPPTYVDPRTVEPEYRRIIIDLGLGDIYIRPGSGDG